MGEPRRHGSGPARLLPLPRLVDGALGRTGGGDLHRRHGDRGGAGSQRAAACPLLGDRRRPGGAGQRGGRARRRPGVGGPQGAPAAGPHVPGGHVEGSHRRRRRDQGGAGGGAPLRRLAGRGPGPLGEPAAAPDAHAPARQRGHPPAALRLHHRRAAAHRRPHGSHGGRADRLHGLGHRGGRALRAPAPVVRLLHPALRPGHEPSSRRHPGGAGDVAGCHRRPGGQPPGGHSRVVPADRAAPPGHRPRRPGQADVRERVRRDARLQGVRHRRALPGGRRGRRRTSHCRGGEGSRRGHRRRAGPHLGRHRRRGQPDRPLRPELDHRDGAHPLAAAGGGGPSPLGAGAVPYEGGVGGGDRGRPRGPPHGAAHRLRGGRRQPLPGAGVDRRHDRQRAARGGVAPPGAQALHQGGLQGCAQGHVQDGHLHRGLLHRRPGLRGHRARPVGGRRVLHRHRQPDRRRRARRPGRRGGRPPPAGPSRASHRAGPPRARGRRRVPVAP